MSKEKTVDLGLKTAFDELFMSDAGRAENRLPKIYDIPLSEIDDFPDHPFQVRLDDDMDALVQSVKERGTLILSRAVAGQEYHYAPFRSWPRRVLPGFYRLPLLAHTGQDCMQDQL